MMSTRSPQVTEGRTMADPPVKSATTQPSEVGFIGIPTDSTPVGVTTFGVIGVASESTGPVVELGIYDGLRR